MNNLGGSFATYLRQLLDAGFVMPILVATVSANGAACVVRYDASEKGDLDPTFVCNPTGDFRLPLNLMFVDARGEAARLVIAPDGQTKLLH